MESRGSAEACRRELAKQLREKASVIERDITERTRALAEERGEENGGDAEEVKRVVQAVLEHAFRAIEGRQDRHPPPEVVTHARGLAWKALRTSAVLRRYEAGAAVFKEHLRQARSCVKPYSAAGYDDAERAVECAFEQLQDRVESAHIEEEQELKSSPEARKLKRIEEILSGQLLNPPDDLGYDFSATHIGVVGSGPSVDDEILRLAQMLGGETLIVQASPDKFWAWIGLKLESSVTRLDDARRAVWADAVRMVAGKPADGLIGWRRTHCQAKVALPVAIRGDAPLVFYADVALLATTAEDKLLPNFLWENYLAPLTSARDGGKTLRAVLRAYFSGDRHISSAAKALGIKRHTVRRRLDDIEELLGRTLESCSAELELALRLEELRYPQSEDAA